MKHLCIVLNVIFTVFIGVFNLQDADLSPVLRALNDSIIRTFPLARYTPVTRREKIQAFIADHFPSSFYDIIYS
jgi:3-hydroxybutyrate dehydrogenase